MTDKLYATDYGVSGERYRNNFVNTNKGTTLSPLSWFVLSAGTAWPSHARRQW